MYTPNELLIELDFLAGRFEALHEERQNRGGGTEGAAEENKGKFRIVKI